MISSIMIPLKNGHEVQIIGANVNDLNDLHAVICGQKTGIVDITRAMVNFPADIWKDAKGLICTPRVNGLDEQLVDIEEIRN